MDMSYYEKCIEQMANILNTLRDHYPKMVWSFFDKNILKYMWVDPKILSPSRKIVYSNQRYLLLLNFMKEFKEKKFIKWLLTDIKKQ